MQITINFSLPENLRDFFETRLAELGIEGPEYLERLVHEEKKRLIGEYYLKEVQKGIESVANEGTLSEEEFLESQRNRMSKYKNSKKTVAGRV